SERVVGQDHVTLARQVREQLLVAWPCLAVHRMAEWSQNRRMTSSLRWHVEVRGDVESRPALERQLLDAIARPFDDARHSRIEGISLERSPEHLPDVVDHRFLPGHDFLTRGNRIDHLFATIARVVRDAD